MDTTNNNKDGDKGDKQSKKRRQRGRPKNDMKGTRYRQNKGDITSVVRNIGSLLVGDTSVFPRKTPMTISKKLVSPVYFLFRGRLKLIFAETILWLDNTLSKAEYSWYVVTSISF